MKNYRSIFIILFVVAIVSVSYVSYRSMSKREASSISNSHKIQIVTSFYPLYYFASQIGGEKTHVVNITPAGAEPHDYEPTTRDLTLIENASVLILNGGQLESWGDKVKGNLQNKTVRVITASDGLMTQDLQKEDEIVKDPHVWLDPMLAKKQVQKIAQILSDIDPTNKEYYERNAKNLENRLNTLDQSFRDGLKSCEHTSIVTSHAAFGYIASRYNLEQVSITGLSPDQEPSPKQIADIATFAKKNNVKYIFFETLVSPKLSETIANEIGAKTIEFNPLEGLTEDEQRQGKDYFSIQQENLKNLRTALGCQ